MASISGFSSVLPDTEVGSRYDCRKSSAELVIIFKLLQKELFQTLQTQVNFRRVIDICKYV